MCVIHVSAQVYPTEDRAKVAAAILNLFPDAIIEDGETISATCSNLETFSEQLSKQRIRTAARRVLMRGVEGSEARFRVNKQVATTGKVTFSEEDHPLGDIVVVIRSPDIHAVIDDVAPPSKEVPR